MNNHDKLLAIEDEIRCWLRSYDKEIVDNDYFRSTSQRIARFEAIAKYNATKAILDFVNGLLNDDPNTVEYAKEKAVYIRRTPMTDLLKRLFDYRLDHNLTWDELGKLLSVSAATLHGWERDTANGKRSPNDRNKRKVENYWR